MIIADLKTWNSYTEYLKANFPKELRATAASYLFEIAKETRENAISEIQSNFTLRNQFTKTGILYQVRTKANSLNQMQAEIGGIESRGYLKRQELGGMTPRSSKGVIIPQTSARTGSNPAKQVKKSKRLQNLQSNLRFSNYRGHFKSKKAAIVAMAFAARKKNKPFELPWHKGVFELKGKVNSLRSGKVRFKTRFLYSYAGSVKTPERPWLMPATKKTMQKADSIFLTAAKKKMKNVTFKI